jgi:hypothetical protein
MSSKRISVPQPDSQERSYLRQGGQLLREGRAGLEQGAYSQNILAPYLYDLAGLDVQYEDRSPRLQELQANYDKSLAALSTVKSARGKKAKKAAVAELTKGGEFSDLANKRGKIKAGKLKKYLQGQIQGQEREIGDISAAPLRIKSITEKAGSKEQRAREEAILKQEQEMLLKSLSMTPEDVLAADPALRRQLQEEQARLQQAQVQQFGDLSGAAGGTVGAVQNAAMAQRRAEAISNARRENIGLYAGLQTAQADANSQLAARKQGMGSVPSQQQQATGLNFGQLSQGYAGLIGAKAGQRQMQFQANSFNQTQPKAWEQAMKGIGSLLQPFKQEG